MPHSYDFFPDCQMFWDNIGKRQKEKPRQPHEEASGDEL